MFRQRALQELDQRASEDDEILRLSPVWSERVFWLVVAALALGLVAVLIIRVPERASGVAVLRDPGRTELRARAEGIVADVRVREGELVEPEAVLIQLRDDGERAELARIEAEIEGQLAQRLLDPLASGPAQALVALRAGRELAFSRLSQRELRAPRRGTVSDLRVRAGQPVRPGDPILSLEEAASIEGGGAITLLALVAGDAAPQLEPGLPLRLELDGYPYLYRRLRLETVGRELLGAEEARRFLGPDAADGFDLRAPVVLVTATLPDPSFEVEGRAYRYRDGMRGRVEITLRSERLIFTLLPALEALRGGMR